MFMKCDKCVFLLQILDEILLEPVEEAGLQFFTCRNNDPVNRGSSRIRLGCVFQLIISQTNGL